MLRITIVFVALLVAVESFSAIRNIRSNAAKVHTPLRRDISDQNYREFSQITLTWHCPQTTFESSDQHGKRGDIICP